MRIAAGLSVLALVLLTASIASAEQASGITSSRIAGAGLGKTVAEYRTVLGPVSVGQLEGGYTRLTARGKVEVYLRGGEGVAITTWKRANTTAEGVGPCSSVADLKRAYGSKLRAARFLGTLHGYRLGKLLFATEGSSRVRVVMLSASPAYDFIAYNSLECR